jgi:hypothetical protein
MVGGISQMREIVKEGEIYKRERLVNLKILPYVMSKIWVAALLAFYQAAVYTIVHYLVIRHARRNAGILPGIYHDDPGNPGRNDAWVVCIGACTKFKLRPIDGHHSDAATDRFGRGIDTGTNIHQRAHFLAMGIRSIDSHHGSGV